MRGMGVLRVGSICGWVVLLGACSGGSAATDGGATTDAETDAGARDGGRWDANDLFDPCGPDNCSGCCLGELCMPGTSRTRCGTAGEVCRACSDAASCEAVDGGQGGTCVTGPDWGTACEVNEDCPSVGERAVCKRQTRPGGTPYEGGYCTQECGEVGAPCRGNATCLQATGLGELDRICARRCTVGSTNECRTQGYACYDLGGGVGICWIAPLPPGPDAGPPLLSPSGTPCQVDSQCQVNGELTQGFCRAPVDDAGMPTGWTGGYCTADCTEDEFICGRAELCLDVLDEGRPSCVQACGESGVGMGDCRTGYVCEPYRSALPDGGTQTSSHGYCIPDCGTPGFVCAAGSSCDEATGYCR